MKSFYKTCAGHTLLPRSLHCGPLENPMGVPLCRGGSADVLKREYRGREVAIKVLRTHSGNGSRDMTNVGCWRTFILSHVLANRR